MPNKPSFRKWLLQNLAGLAVAGPVVFLLLPHFVFGIDWRPLMPYFLAEVLVLLVATPLLYWGARIGWKKSDWKPQVVIVGLTGGTICWLTFHFAAKFGVLSPAAAHGCVVAMLLTLPPALVGAYYVNFKLYAERFAKSDKHGSSEP